MRKRIAVLSVVVAWLGACADSQLATAPRDMARLPGILQLSGWTGTVTQAGFTRQPDVRWSSAPAAGEVAPERVIVAPDTVRAGVAFEVTTYTVGPSGCWRSDGQIVTVGGRVVELQPFDAHSGADICTGALVFLPHASTLTLGSVGEWTLRVSGRRARHGDATWVEPVTAEKTIIVRAP